MKNLHDHLTDDYNRHYARVNTSANQGKLPTYQMKHMKTEYEALIKHLPEGSQVLDLGCGTGMLLQWLSSQPAIIPVGVDSSISQIEECKRNLPNVDVVCCDGIKFLQQHMNHFSGIFCIDVLEHVDGEDECLRLVEAAWNALNDGGFFYCRVPNAANIIASYYRYMDLTHQRSFTRTSITQLLEAGGFTKCMVTPLRCVNVASRLRFGVEALLHKVIFRICSQALENVFTHDLCVIAYKEDSGKQ